MPNIGLPEILILLIVLLLVFGPKRLPGLGRSLGQSMREFKDSVSGKDKKSDDEEKNEPPEISATVTESPLTGSPESETVDGEVVSEPKNDS